MVTMVGVHGIVPAAGSASRMRGLPKFLLPCDANYQSLIERHVTRMLEYCETIWIPTRPDFVALLHSLKIASSRVIILSTETQTMTETVMKVTEIANSDRFMLCMPDTYFYGESPYASLSLPDGDACFACWKIEESQRGKLGQVKLREPSEKSSNILDSKDKDQACVYPLAWGALSFNRRFLESADPLMPHVGYMINPAISRGCDIRGFQVEGRYFDCGTPSEYLEMIFKQQL
jgi:hypothetical protein